MSWKKISEGFGLKNLLQNFLQGLVVLAPICVTAYVVVWLFSSIDNILPNIIYSIFPKLENHGGIKYFPGLGFIVFIFIIIVVGRLSSFFFISRLVALFDTILEHTPGIKHIYSAVKDFLEAFAGNKKKFDRTVLVNVDGSDVWRIGFVTQESAKRFEMDNHLVVYVPHSYAISGITYIVPKEKVKPFKNISSTEAMKFTVSGGVTEFEIINADSKSKIED